MHTLFYTTAITCAKNSAVTSTFFSKIIILLVESPKGHSRKTQCREHWGLNSPLSVLEQEGCIPKETRVKTRLEQRLKIQKGLKSSWKLTHIFYAWHHFVCFHYKTKMWRWYKFIREALWYKKDFVFSISPKRLECFGGNRISFIFYKPLQWIED